MNKFNLVISILLLATAFTSCNEKEEAIYKMSSPDSKSNSNTSAQVIKKHIYYAHWEQFGRTSMGCQGFGLCHFEDCFNCCTENDVIVDCPTNMLKLKTGVASFEEGKTESVLTFRLNPADREQQNAIERRASFFIDKDLQSEHLILKKGEYPYKENVGRYGGYEITTLMK